MKKLVTKVVNLSKNKCNYSQRNNKINPSATCGPTNMMQAFDYAGWELPTWRFPEYEQVEDQFTKFCRTDKEVLDYYERKYPSMYNNWKKDWKGEDYWKDNFPNSFPPNEVHDVLSFAANRFMGYQKDEITNFVEKTSEIKIIDELCNNRPVVCSVKFGNYGHIITIVGFEYKVDLKYADVNNRTLYYKGLITQKNITNYIIDNTYGRFNFDTMKYDAVSGNDEKIERTKFLSMLKPIGCEDISAHFFKNGPATI